MRSGEETTRSHQRALDALNFLLADVRGALGPFLVVFLVTERRWSNASVGLVTAVGGALALAFQTPAGALIDRSRAKRGLVVAALAILGVGATVIFAFPGFWPVMAANAAVGFAGDIFGPAVAALTLGLTGRAALTRRLGRNSAFDHAGNVAIAALAGLVGWAFSQRAVFLLAPACAVLASAVVLSIPAGDIDHEAARGARTDGETNVSSWSVLLTCRPLVSFAACLLLFHLANAPLLPLVGQKLALAHRGAATPMMSACIIAAQLIMVPMAILVGRTADRLGRKPLLLAAFGILPLRAMLYPFSDAAPWLVGVQLLDGVGAGLIGALTPVVISDAMRGTGRFNVAQGAVATVQGIGASLSGLFAGVIVDHAGYSVAFRALGGVALLALAVLLIAMPETGPSRATARWGSAGRTRRASTTGPA
jgi:MFS family permease